MKAKPQRILTALMLFIGLVTQNALASKVELPHEELHRLNRVMAAADLYNRDKTKYIDSLETQFDAIQNSKRLERCEAAINISREYLPMRADSALTYSEIALRLAKEIDDPKAIFKSQIARINALSTAGIFTRALSDFQSIDAMSLTPDMKISYWTAGRKLYGYMRNYVEGDRRFFKDYSDFHKMYEDSLVLHLPERDLMRRFYIGESLVNQGKNAEAQQMLQELFSTLPEESNLYGMTAFQLGIVARNQGDLTGYAAYMAKAAISDIKGCVKDGMALPALAEFLFEQGELNDAFKYINFALEDAMAGNVRMRTITIAALLPGIDEAYRNKINASRDELMIYFLLVTFLFILSVALLVMLLRTVKRGKLATQKLAQTAKMQESYIGHFIGLCSTYAGRLESLQKLVSRKISSGQSEELLQLIKTGKLSDDLPNDELYKIFDSALLDIYPDFIDNLNELLKPEERIELDKNGTLPPEVRIYGFVRLGVTESQRIARFLNYSVSTVYAYRNRMRRKAISHDTFDDDVMKIGRDKTPFHKKC